MFLKFVEYKSGQTLPGNQFLYQCIDDLGMLFKWTTRSCSVVIRSLVISGKDE